MNGDLLRSTSLRQAMVAYALRRGAGADAEDAVQATLTEAWQKAERPTDPELLRRWLWGILRHKVVDTHRKRSREIVAGDLESPDSHAPAHRVDPVQEDGANDLLRWASRNLPEGRDTKQTLDWLLREAEGESLDRIAHEAALPPARVRKRVSRLREHFRLHWQRDVAALAALGVVLGVLFWLWPRPITPEPIARDPQPTTPDPRHQRSIELRDLAHDACEHGNFRRCLELLDEAQGLGEPESPRDVANRRRATPPPLAPAPSATSVAPPPRSTTTSPTTPTPLRKPQGKTSDFSGSL